MLLVQTSGGGCHVGAMKDHHSHVFLTSREIDRGPESSTYGTVPIFNGRSAD